MPSKTPAQARLMAAVAHSPKIAKETGVPQSVGREFNKADTGTKMLSKAMSQPNAPPKGAPRGK